MASALEKYTRFTDTVSYSYTPNALVIRNQFGDFNVFLVIGQKQMVISLILDPLKPIIAENKLGFKSMKFDLNDTSIEQYSCFNTDVKKDTFLKLLLSMIDILNTVLSSNDKFKKFIEYEEYDEYDEYEEYEENNNKKSKESKESTNNTNTTESEKFNTIKNKVIDVIGRII